MTGCITDAMDMLSDGEGQRGLVCCFPWDYNELDMAGQLNSN